MLPMQCETRFPVGPQQSKAKQSKKYMYRMVLGYFSSHRKFHYLASLALLLAISLHVGREFQLLTALLSCEHLYNAIATCADDPSPILAPHDRADALAAHKSMASDFLRATSRLKGPES